MKTLRKIYDKKVFLTAFFATILIHGEMLFNKISFHDDLDKVFDGWTNSIRHGRWMYRLLSLIPEKLAGMESTPVVIGIIVAICIGLMACLFFELFEVREYYVQFALILIFCAIPAIAGDFGYMGYAGYDSIGRLLCLTGAYFTCCGINRKKNIKSMIVAVLALACAMGEYQCHVTFFLTIMLVYFTKHILEDTTWKEFWLKAVCYVGTAIAGLVLYLGILKISLAVTGKTLTSYAGMDSYGVVEFSEYIDRLMFVYTDFLNIHSVADYSMIPFEWDGWRLLALLALFGLALAVVCISALRKEYKKAAQFIIAIALLPLGLNFNFVMYGVSATHSLHMYQWVLLFIVFVVLGRYTADNIAPMLKERKWTQIAAVQWIQGAVVAVIMIFGVLYVRYDNMCYTLLEMRQESAIRYFTTLVTKIESVEGYKSEYEIAYINEFEKNNLADRILTDYDYPITNPFDMSFVNAYNWQRFVEYWCGFDMDNADPAEYENRPEVEEMPSYPDDGAIKIIDEVVVVKF